MFIECQLYWARPCDARPEHRRWFTDAERGRADAYRRDVDRNRFTVGCALSRLALGELLAVAPAAVPLVRDCADCGQPHGRPRVLIDGTAPSRMADAAKGRERLRHTAEGREGLRHTADAAKDRERLRHTAERSVWPGRAESPADDARRLDEPAFVSVSHSGEHVVVVVTRAGPVGVDVEQHRPGAVDLAETVLTATEHAWLAALPGGQRVGGFFGLWTRKEAVLKATGHGLRVPMDAIDAGDAETPRVVPGRADKFAGLAAAVARLSLVELAVDGEHSAALAVGDRPTGGDANGDRARPPRPRVVHIDGSALLRDAA